MPGLEAPSETFRFGAFEANLPARELRKHGILVKLSGQPFEIVALLLERPGDSTSLSTGGLDPTYRE
jgi:DNA-binding response OmpR family regulator